MIPNQPSDCHPDLTEERLGVLAQFFADTRSAVAVLHDMPAGDDGWSLGCRGFARWRNGLLQYAATGIWDWFGIVNPGKQFVFRIGAVPVRFYRGSIEQPPSRTLAYSAPELYQKALAFDDETPYAQLHWRFAIETGPLGEPTNVIFAGLAQEEGDVVCSWNIPFDAVAEPLAPANVEDMVELPAPAVTVEKNTQNAKETPRAHGGA